MSDATLHADLALIGDALRRDPAAARTLVQRLRPIIQARVARVLARHRSPALRRNQREEVADLCQDVFRVLFEREGHVLKAWTPDRGASLENFVGLVAQRHALSIVRTKRRSPWTEEPMAEMEQVLPSADSPESAVITKQLMSRVVGELRDELSAKGLELFELLIVQERSATEVQEAMGMSRDAVYAWRSRLTKAIRKKMQEHMSDSGGQSRNPEQGAS